MTDNETKEPMLMWLIVTAVVFGLMGLLFGYFYGKEVCIKTPHIIYIEKGSKP